MTESQEVSGRKRRSREEIQRLMMEFEASGLRQNEFCRKHGLALSTLQRQLKKRRLDQGQAKSNRLVAVELANKGRDGNNRTLCALEVVLASGRRIEVRRDFDSETLLRVVEILEEI
jgi:transposase-like protein